MDGERPVSGLVEIKSFSITRLKPEMSPVEAFRWHISWNQKFLDYEIETTADNVQALQRSRLSWNQKFLDYEIET